MQNLDKKASILIWAVMLSLIIAISFISISAKINKSIKLSGRISEFNSQNTKLNSALYKNTNTQLSKNKVIIFESSLQKVITLKKADETTLTFSWPWNFNVDLAVVDWTGWAISYSYIFNSITTHSWVLNYSHSFSWQLDSTNNTGSLILKNLWWYSQVFIKSENEFESTQKKYKIVQTIGNNNFTQTRGSTNTTP